MVYENELTAEEISVLRLIDIYKYRTLSNIKKKAFEYGYSQAQIADFLNISPSAVSRYK